MAENIPLNLFKRITVPLNRDSDSTPAYTVPSNRASIIINSLISNNSNDNRLVTISLSTANPSFPLSTGTAPRYSFTLTKELYDELIQVPEVSANLVNLVNNGLPLTVQPQNKYDIAKDVSIESLDVQNLTFSKLVLVDGDNLVAKADVEDIRTIQDPNALWEFDLPTTTVGLSGFAIGLTNSANITADFGTGGIPNNQRFYNADFNDWTGHTTGLRLLSSGLGTGSAGWTQGLNISQTNQPSGTYEIIKQTSSADDLQYFDNNFYSRLQFDNVYYGTNNIVSNLFTPAGSALGGTGALAVQDILKDSQLIFGQTIKASFWARASQPTKLMTDLIFRSVSPQRPGGVYYYGGIQNRYAIFDLTTNWQKYEWTVTAPTYSQFRNEAYNLDTASTQSLTDPNWGSTLYTYPSTDPTVSLPLSTFGAQFSIRTLLSRWTNFAVGSKMTQTELSSVIINSITNGHYDIGGLELYISSTALESLSTTNASFNYTYDLSNDTGTNLTLSILETNNQP